MYDRLISITTIAESMLNIKRFNLDELVNKIKSILPERLEPVKFILPFLPEENKRTLPFSNCKVNLYYMTCTCKDYRIAAGKYPKKDLRRICKHLFNQLLSNHTAHLDELTILMLENKFWFNQEQLFAAPDGDEFYIGYGNEWIVFTIKEEKWKRFAYNYIEKYWNEELLDDNILCKVKKYFFLE